MAADKRSRGDIGKLGEGIAAKFLHGKGFEIIARNYRKPWGEIDIIAAKDGVVRFVEVKSVSRESFQDVARESNEYRPEEMAHASKLQKVARTAEMYMNEVDDHRDYQIDVVAVFLSLASRKARCRLYEQVL